MHRVFRALRFYFTYIFREIPKGLNFSSRKKNLGVLNNGYAKTELEDIVFINSLFPFENRKFLDIGSGKGFVVLKAFELGASICEGIEIDSQLHRIAERNFRRLGLSEKCRSTNVRAENFKRYNDFDYFFVFNPFNQIIFETVLFTIISQSVSVSSKDRILVISGEVGSPPVEMGAQLRFDGHAPRRKNRLQIYVF